MREEVINYHWKIILSDAQSGKFLNFKHFGFDDTTRGFDVLGALKWEVHLLGRLKMVAILFTGLN